MKKFAFVFAAVIMLVLAPDAGLAARVAFPANGDYYIVPSSSSSFAMDVQYGKLAPETPIWLYRKNNSPAQVFTLKRVDGDWYTITHKASGLAINIRKGDTENDARLWLYRDEGAAGCYWRFRNLGGGYYVIQSRLGAQRVIDLHNNDPHDEAVIHMWEYHDGPSAAWKLIPLNPQPIVIDKKTLLK